MPRSPSPFTGIKLTQQMDPASSGLDQRLFGKAPDQQQSESVQQPPAQETKPITPIRAPTSARSKGVSKPSHSSTTTPWLHEAKAETMIETIRQALKQLGKEAATYRFTEAEKRALADIVYSYKVRGIRTSENELTRVAINFLIQDYRENGKVSILATILERLNA